MTKQYARRRAAELAKRSNEMLQLATNPRLPGAIRYECAVMVDSLAELAKRFEALAK